MATIDALSRDISILLIGSDHEYFPTDRYAVSNIGPVKYRSIKEHFDIVSRELSIHCSVTPNDLQCKFYKCVQQLS